MLDSVNTNANFDSKHPHSLYKEITCYGCMKKTQKDKMGLVNYDDIFKYHQTFHNILQMKRKFLNEFSENIEKKSRKYRKNTVIFDIFYRKIL